MTREESSAAQLQRALAQAKSVRPVPRATRARVLERARTSTLPGAIATASVPPAWTNAVVVSAALGGAVVALGIAGAVLAFRGHERPTLQPVARSTTAVALSPASPAEPALTAAAPSSTLPVSATPAVPLVTRSASASDSYTAELELMRRAHGAYGRSELDAALKLLAEHRRRFPHGRLAEEREALRVRALRGSGQLAAAQTAAHAFALRFPHSVLLARTLAAAGVDE